MTTQHDPNEQRRVARNLARRAMLDLASAAGAQTITRRAFRGSHATVHAGDYVRAAREAGHSWQDVGTSWTWSRTATRSRLARPSPRLRSLTPPDTRTPKPPAATADPSFGAAARATS